QCNSKTYKDDNAPSLAAQKPVGEAPRSEFGTNLPAQRYQSWTSRRFSLLLPSMRIANWLGTTVVCSAFLGTPAAPAQDLQETGKSIGAVSTQGNLIVMTLNENVLGKANLFDLRHRTLRFA